MSYVAADRDVHSTVGGHVGDVRRQSGEIRRDELLEYDVLGAVEKHLSVDRLGARLVGVIQQQVQRHVLSAL